MPKSLSWSEIVCFETDREEWYRRYCLGLRPEPTFPMRKGTDIHALVAGTSNAALDAPHYLPGEKRTHGLIRERVAPFLPPNVSFEKRVEITIEGIPTIGVWDAWKKAGGGFIGELKTTSRSISLPDPQHVSQLYWYALQYRAKYKRDPEQLVLIVAGTKNGRVKPFSLLPPGEAREIELAKVLARAEHCWHEMGVHYQDMRFHSPKKNL